MDFLITQYLTIRPGDESNSFPPVDVPFILLSENDTEDEVSIKKHTGWPYHIHLKKTKFYKNHLSLEQGNKVHISVIEPMKKYRLEIV